MFLKQCFVYIQMYIVMYVEKRKRDIKLYIKSIPEISLADNEWLSRDD